MLEPFDRLAHDPVKQVLVRLAVRRAGVDPGASIGHGFLDGHAVGERKQVVDEGRKSVRDQPLGRNDMATILFRLSRPSRRCHGKHRRKYEY